MVFLIFKKIKIIFFLQNFINLDLYVNEFWQDPALSYDFMRPCKGNLSFDYNMQDSIWIPNTCFINSKRAQIHSSPFRNVFLMVFPNGKLFIIFNDFNFFLI